jgi:hypothetical protein
MKTKGGIKLKGSITCIANDVFNVKSNLGGKKVLLPNKFDVEFEKKFKLKYFIIVLLIQTSVVFWTLLLKVTNIFNVSFITILKIDLFIIVWLSFLSIILPQSFLQFVELKYGSEIKKIELEKSKELIKNLRAQKHDFLNHLQTIYGMINLKNILNL